MNNEARVELFGKAHEDARNIMLKSNAGVSSEYIARLDGTIYTVNRQRMGQLTKKLHPHPERKGKLGYKEDVLTLKQRRGSRRRSK